MLPVFLSISQVSRPTEFALQVHDVFQGKFILKYDMQVSWLPTPMAID
jgi:hypothetical protein